MATNTSFASMKQVNAGVLRVGYAEDGPADGQPVILLHGWPFDIHAFVDVAPLLAKAGYRVIVPYQRGYGSTTFLSPNGWFVALLASCAIIATLDILFDQVVFRFLALASIFHAVTLFGTI